MMMAKAMASPLASSPSLLLQRSSASLPCMLTRSKPFGFASSAFLCNSGLLNTHRQSINSPRSITATGRPSLAPVASASISTAAAPISVGQKLPEATFAYLDKDGQVQTVSVSDLTKGKKAVFFAVPGAFTPTCSQKHLPGFVEKADELRAKGVDTIACISVNDAFVMRAWGESIGVGDKVLLLSDGNLGFTKAMGVTLDLSDKPVGLGVRSRRYSLLAEDGIVKVLHLEEGGSFTTSGAEDILKAL